MSTYRFIGVEGSVRGVCVEVPAPNLDAAYATLLRNSYLCNDSLGATIIRRIYREVRSEVKP